MFEKFAKPKWKLILQEGDPLQNSVNQELLGSRLGDESLPYQQIVQISTQLKIFHTVKRKLHHDDFELAITREDFESFLTRVKRTLETKMLFFFFGMKKTLERYS